MIRRSPIEDPLALYRDQISMASVREQERTAQTRPVTTASDDAKTTAATANATASAGSIHWYAIGAWAWSASPAASRASAAGISSSDIVVPFPKEREYRAARKRSVNWRRCSNPHGPGNNSAVLPAS